MTGKKVVSGDFRKLWMALGISLTGSEVTTLALPLIAALTLHASALQMGILTAVGELPYLLCSLAVGVVADRMHRRPLLIGSDLVSAVFLISLPVAIPFGGPYFPQLCVVAFGIGTCYLIQNVAHYAYVPTLVSREQLTAVNSRLQICHSASEAAGPGLAGVIIQLLTAPAAVLVDAFSFLMSAALLSRVRHQEEPPRSAENPDSAFRDALSGVRLLFTDSRLRAITLTGPVWMVFATAQSAVYLLYLTRNLGLHPAEIGLVAAAGGAGALPGAGLAVWAGRRFGVGWSIIGGWMLNALMLLAVPLAAGPFVVVVLILAVAQAVGGLVGTVANVHQWTLRQAVTPDYIAGRVTAASRFIVYGAGAFGGLAGGVLGSAIGLRATLVLCAAGCLTAPLFELFSPIRRLREQPEETVEAETAPAQAS